MFQYPRPTTTNPRPGHASVPILSPNCCYLSLTVDFCPQLFLSCPLVVRNLSATVPGVSRSIPNCSLLSPTCNFFCFVLSMLLYIYTINARVNPKSLPPCLGETRRRSAQHENGTDPVPPFRN